MSQAVLREQWAQKLADYEASVARQLRRGAANPV